MKILRSDLLPARLLSCQYPKRSAQEALGHNSKAVHRAYARRALVKIPCLEEYENNAAEKVKLPAAIVSLALGSRPA